MVQLGLPWGQGGRNQVVILESHCQSTHLCLHIYIHLSPSTLPSPLITWHTKHLHEAPASISSTWSGHFSLSLCQHHKLKWLIYIYTVCWCSRVQTDGQPSRNTTKALSAPLHNSGWGHFRLSWKHQDKVAAALVSQGNFLLVYQQSPIFTTEEEVLQRHSDNHFLVHSTSIVRQTSINTLLTYRVSLRLSLSPWQLSDDV